MNIIIFYAGSKCPYTRTPSRSMPFLRDAIFTMASGLHQILQVCLYMVSSSLGMNRFNKIENKCYTKCSNFEIEFRRIVFF